MQQVNYDSAHSSEAAQGAAIEAGLASQNNNGGFASIAAAAAGGAAAGTVSKATAGLGNALGIDVPQALQLGGLAQNPFLTVLFQSPAFKRHSFSWKLAPNNAQESNSLREIINAFKSNMLPGMSPNAGGTLLTYPNMAIINLYPDETFLYKFKPCVVESLNVNYAVGGQPSFFKGTNAPTLVQIDVNFLEIEYWLKEDIEDNSLILVKDSIWKYENKKWSLSNSKPHYENLKYLCEFNNLDISELNLDKLDCIYRKDIGCSSKIDTRLNDNIQKVTKIDNGSFLTLQFLLISNCINIGCVEYNNNIYIYIILFLYLS
jgi:hypothetical protein